MRGPRPAWLTCGARAADMCGVLDSVQGILHHLLSLPRGALQEGKLLVQELLLEGLCVALLRAKEERLDLCSWAYSWSSGRRAWGGPP